ncbi:hypothetical protein D3C80_962220 [compost metagenome]
MYAEELSEPEFQLSCQRKHDTPSDSSDLVQVRRHNGETSNQTYPDQETFFYLSNFFYRLQTLTQSPQRLYQHHLRNE